MLTNDERIQAMQQQFNELRQAIANDIADRFEAGERRLRENLSKDLAERFEASEQRLRDNLSKDLADRFAASERRLREDLSKDLAAQLTAMGEQLEDRLERRLDARLSHRLNVQAEQLREIVTTAADNYGGVLAGIKREVADFRDEWRKEADDTRGILANHRGRIEAIEKTLSSS